MLFAKRNLIILLATCAKKNYRGKKKSPHSTAVLSKVLSHHRAFVGAGYKAVVTSSDTIFCVLKSIWPGSEKGACSVLRGPNSSSLNTFSTRTTPEWNFIELDTPLGNGCSVKTEKEKKSGVIPALISEKKLLLAWN